MEENDDPDSLILTFDFLKVIPKTVSSVGIAAYSGDIDLLKDLIKSKASVRTRDNKGMIPLHYAAYNGNFDCLLLLLKAGPDEINVASFEGFTALDVACKSKISPECQFDIIAALFEAGATTDNLRDLFSSSINRLIECGNLPAVHLFIAAGADLTLCDSKYGTALHASISLNEIAIMRYLIKIGATDESVFSHYGFCALHSALIYLNAPVRLEMLKEFLSNDIYVKHINKSEKIEKRTPISFACCNGYFEEINLLMDYGADVNVCDIRICQSPLFNIMNHMLELSSISSEDWNVVYRLLDLTSDEIIFKEAGNLLYIAIYGQMISLLSKLLDREIIPRCGFLDFLPNRLTNVPFLVTLREIVDACLPAKLDPLGFAVFLDFNEVNSHNLVVIELLRNGGWLLDTAQIENGVKIIPPFVTFFLNVRRLYKPEKKQEFKLLNKIIQLSPDLSWKSSEKNPIPDLYMAPFFNGNRSALNTLLQWGIDAQFIFTTEKCAQMVQFVEKSDEKPIFKSTWYLQILNEFMPRLSPIIIKLYSKLKDYHDIKEYLTKILVEPKSLQRLSVLAVRKQLYSANKIPLKLSIDKLRQHIPPVMYPQLLCNDIVRHTNIPEYIIRPYTA